MRSASRFLPLVFAFACTPPASRAIARLTAESEVRLAQRQRFEAMMKQDVVALDTLLDDELDYVHTGGDLQTRPQFIDMIKKQTLVYESIAPSEVKVRVYDGLALATGRSQMRVRSAAGVSSFGIRFTEVYVRRDGRWLLTAWEATKLPANSAGERSRAGLASTKPKLGVFGFAASRLELLYRRNARKLQMSVR
jgi:hypothetical protein